MHLVSLLDSPRTRAAEAYGALFADLTASFGKVNGKAGILEILPGRVSASLASTFEQFLYVREGSLALGPEAVDDPLCPGDVVYIPATSRTSCGTIRA